MEWNGCWDHQLTSPSHFSTPHPPSALRHDSNPGNGHVDLRWSADLLDNHQLFNVLQGGGGVLKKYRVLFKELRVSPLAVFV